ncbi:hypothetical protein [Actinophytocola sp.]|uniref:hypothetical protein n=1 Tax=Actinophytocola sp. TaxID=1872138 RepID=UPI003D6A9E09
MSSETWHPIGAGGFLEAVDGGAVERGVIVVDGQPEHCAPGGEEAVEAGLRVAALVGAVLAVGDDHNEAGGVRGGQVERAVEGVEGVAEFVAAAVGVELGHPCGRGAG